MAQPKDFLFYLRSKNGANYDYYSIVGGSFTTTTSATPINPITYLPKGWNQIQLKLSRTLETKGIFRDIAESFSFVKDGAHILRKKYFEGGVNANLELLIMKFNTSSAVYDYELFFNGSFDFNTSNDEDNFFIIKVKEAGFLNKYEARKSTKYKIPITNNANVQYVHFNGIYLQCIFNYVAIGAGGTDPTNNFDEYPLFGYVGTEGTNLSSYLYDIDAPSGATSLLQNTSSVPITYRIQYTGSLITLKTSGASSYAHIIIRQRDAGGTLVAGFTSIFASGLLPAGVSNVIPFTIDTNVVVTAGYFLEISVIMLDSASPSGVGFVNSTWNITGGNSNLIISVNNRTKEGYVPTLSRMEVFSELVKLIGDNTTTASSTLLTTTWADKWLFSGDCARNLDNANLYISMDDFFESINNSGGAMLNYDKATDVFSIEAISNAFQNTLISNIGEVANMKVTPLSGEFYSKVLIGQSDYTYDSVNGKDEFNTEVEMLSPLEGIKESKSLLSSVRRDVYGIETTRENLSDKKVTDAETDNDIFEVHADYSIIGTIPPPYQGAGLDYIDVYIDGSLTITNIYGADSMYNIWFSPRRAFLRNGAWHRSLMFGNDTKYIKFINSKKSNELGLYMITDDGTTIINEGSDILISTLPDPIFKPFVIDIDTYTIDNIVALMNANPYGYIEFTFEGLPYKGFIMNTTRKAMVKEKTSMTLLATASCDLTQLIK